ncbi:MAG: LapA family protein [Aminobacterium sp.]|jgi:putative membrane protein|uniref:Lipopolysaccharide assembly protein A domain-containing protein n=1 Tax=bioreactor metagenome TaxID=1076179 RepID=A0A645EM61_9ZZZZ|nr:MULTISPECIES: LapA family protein [unclassified Aminobacterium]MDD2207176.1 LapA family protein [Aminobacterium sp.]MDD3425667.1 LapA family protein [Aminobacterium sp.]MDD3707124.1 LapA family protein [Aminobacterium sp.]MDD4228703.1 LapA family protein [Aminobacterium sp.]MDD4551718.1 LapA family protein [Aminobacterium sp.]
MRSYALAVGLAMMLSAVFAFQNTGEITVKFLIWTRQVPQGIWEVAVFAGGCVLMWLVSMSAALESRVKYKKQIRELEGKVKKMEEERMSLLNAMNATAAVSSSTVEKVQTHAETEIVEPDFTQREENDKQ